MCIIARMDIKYEIELIEYRLAAAGVSVDDFCVSAGVHRSNWQRWKAGKTSPTMRNWDRAVAAAPSEAA